MTIGPPEWASVELGDYHRNPRKEPLLRRVVMKEKPGQMDYSFLAGFGMMFLIRYCLCWSLVGSLLESRELNAHQDS